MNVRWILDFWGGDFCGLFGSGVAWGSVSKDQTLIHVRSQSRIPRGWANIIISKIPPLKKNYMKLRPFSACMEETHSPRPPKGFHGNMSAQET